MTEEDSNCAGIEYIGRAPSHLVQVKASNNEIKGRIESFIERKREEINFANIKVFCCHEKNNEDSCARVSAVYVPWKYRKNNSLANTSSVPNCSKEQIQHENIARVTPPGVEERLRNVESHLKIDMPVPVDVYARLKKVEERILYLEGLSPEYFNIQENMKSDMEENVKKKVHSLDTLDMKIKLLENNLLVNKKEVQSDSD